MQLNEFLLKLRNKPHLKNARFVVVVENNKDHIRAKNILNGIYNSEGSRRNMTAICQDTKENGSRPGFWTTHSFKERFQSLVNLLLDNDQVSFSSDLVHVNTPNPDKLLIRQLTNYKRIFRENVLWNDTRNISSLGGKKGGQKDDLAFTFQMLLYIMFVYYMKQALRTKGKKSAMHVPQMSLSTADQRLQMAIAA